MKTVAEVFKKYRNTDKPKYADFYQRHLAHLNPLLLLEIGVLGGDSLRAFKEIFPASKIVGIEIDPKIKEKNKDLEIYVGNQKDIVFLDIVIREIGIPDIIIDDGGHTRSCQTESFIHLFPKLNKGGIYIIEDLETSFLEDFNDQEVSAIEHIKTLINPIDYCGKNREPNESIVFNYAASLITFEPNICLIKK